MEPHETTEGSVREIVRLFEECTITREEWKHRHHLLVALCYIEDFGLDAATERMKSGIKKLLTSGFGIDVCKEMPYHETLTIFWMRTIFGFTLLMDGSSLAEKASALPALFDKDYPLRFYSKERLFSEDARIRYISPDLTVVNT